MNADMQSVIDDYGLRVGEPSALEKSQAEWKVAKGKKLSKRRRNRPVLVSKTAVRNHNDAKELAELIDEKFEENGNIVAIQASIKHQDSQDERELRGAKPRSWQRQLQVRVGKEGKRGGDEAAPGQRKSERSFKAKALKERLKAAQVKKEEKAENTQWKKHKANRPPSEKTQNKNALKRALRGKLNKVLSMRKSPGSKAMEQAVRAIEKHPNRENLLGDITARVLDWVTDTGKNRMARARDLREELSKIEIKGNARIMSKYFAVKDKRGRSNEKQFSDFVTRKGHDDRIAAKIFDKKQFPPMEAPPRPVSRAPKRPVVTKLKVASRISDERLLRSYVDALGGAKKSKKPTDCDQPKAGSLAKKPKRNVRAGQGHPSLPTIVVDNHGVAHLHGTSPQESDATGSTKSLVGGLSGPGIPFGFTSPITGLLPATVTAAGATLYGYLSTPFANTAKAEENSEDSGAFTLYHGCWDAGFDVVPERKVDPPKVSFAAKKLVPPAPKAAERKASRLPTRAGRKDPEPAPPKSSIKKSRIPLASNPPKVTFAKRNPKIKKATPPAEVIHEMPKKRRKPRVTTEYTLVTDLPLERVEAVSEANGAWVTRSVPAQGPDYSPDEIEYTVVFGTRQPKLSNLQDELMMASGNIETLIGTHVGPTTDTTRLFKRLRAIAPDAVWYFTYSNRHGLVGPPRIVDFNANNWSEMGAESKVYVKLFIEKNAKPVGKHPQGPPSSQRGVEVTPDRSADDGKN